MDSAFRRKWAKCLSWRGVVAQASALFSFRSCMILSFSGLEFKVCVSIFMRWLHRSVNFFFIFYFFFLLLAVYGLIMLAFRPF